jgi:hypothetical protein
MRIEEALQLSKVEAAWRPYYIGPAEKVSDKQIVSIGMFEDLFIVYSDTKRYWRQLAEAEWHKVQGMDDWEPVAPK